MIKLGQEISIETGKQTFTTTVRGERKGSYLLLNIPPEITNIGKGMELVTRSFMGGAYIGFTSTIKGVLWDTRMAIIDYPKDQFRSSVRHSERFRVTIPINFTIPASSMPEAPHAAAIWDINRNGFSLVQRLQLDENTIVHMPLTVPGVGGQVLIRGEVLRSERRNGNFHHGVRFLHETKESEKSIEQFYQILRGFDASGGFEVMAESTDPDSLMGVSCQMQIATKRCTTIVRGSMERFFMLTDPPLCDGKHMIIERGAQISANVSYTCHSVICSFQSELVKVYNNPIPIWIWKLPTKVDKRPLRKSPRVNTFIGATMENSSGAIPGALLNLSCSGGLAGFIKGSFSSGQCLTLDLSLPTGERIHQVPCLTHEVRGQEGRQLVGLSFDTNDKSGQELKRYYKTNIEPYYQ